jgi:hypothetical protein
LAAFFVSRTENFVLSVQQTLRRVLLFHST